MSESCVVCGKKITKLNRNEFELLETHPGFKYWFHKAGYGCQKSAADPSAIVAALRELPADVLNEVIRELASEGEMEY